MKYLPLLFFLFCFCVAKTIAQSPLSPAGAVMATQVSGSLQMMACIRPMFGK
jgi:hypothetical protein